LTDERRDDPDSGGGLRERLATIAGVDHVAIDEERREVWLILRHEGDHVGVEQEAAGLVEGYSVHVAFRPERRDRQRVRFVDVRREVLPDQRVSYTVTLEWAGAEHRGTAVGEKGDAIELRTIAAASLDAVCSVVPTELHLKLAGVKQVRAFDADMVVISLYRVDESPHNLVGAVVTGQDVHRATAVAVLNALNRLLGNFLLLP
jgi:hypothetical protein